ncbi:MAG: hypothetical protein WC833_09170 [Bacteroidales bacterium]|jgi:hypothetical protein
MKFTPSINIEQNINDEFHYIATPNAKSVIGNIVDCFNSGIHSFNIIGSYGTGKSSFILALEKNLTENSDLLIFNRGQFNGFQKFHFLNIVGDYAPMMKVINEKLGNSEIVESKNFFDSFINYYKKISKESKFLFVMIDEFGKMLEYAAKNNPEKELYFLQKFLEFINNPQSNIILIATLHQNFNAYAKKLSQEQKNEWTKVKGRFKEIVFNEPVEQLLYLAATRLEENKRSITNTWFEHLYNTAIQSKFVSSSVTYETAKMLYPMDLFAATALTLAIQRYGQNERTLFTFLEAKGGNSLIEFKDGVKRTYSIADVYDYSVYNFYSYLSEINSDYTNWTAMRVALERVEGCFDIELISDASLLVKTIGMLNLFGSAGTTINKDILNVYSKYALSINNPELILDKLLQYKIVRYAVYKSQYILFEGTDIDIEDEILKASSIVPRSRDFIDKLKAYFNFKIDIAISTYYKKGTPRYFEYIISDSPISLVPTDETDGYINLVFDNSNQALEILKQVSVNCTEAILFAHFKNSEDVINHIWQIDKLEYILNSVIIDKSDKIAVREIENLLSYEKGLLNKSVTDAMFNYGDGVIWVYKGKEIDIKSKAGYNRLLSVICDDVYPNTPKFINEMVNKHKPSGAISLARVNYFSSLLEHSDEKELGFPDDKFPPEKTIYQSLLFKTGVHKNLEGVTYELGRPTDESFLPLWYICEDFFNSSIEKPKKLGELIKYLKSKPIKLKQGLIEFWLPTYLIIKKNDYSLYDSNGTYIPQINRETLDIIQKSPAEFSIKAFSVDGVKLDLFNKYREAVNLDLGEGFSTESLIETIRPFLVFYKKLNDYAKRTKKFNNGKTLKFREVISKAKDPEKTFFEDLPRAMGFKEATLADNTEVLHRYVELLQKAIKDLRGCYASLIDRIEDSLVDALSLKSSEYSDYKCEIENRYKNIKTQLLTTKQKTFLNRIITPMQDRTSWYQSISYIVLDKQLESLLDEEEEYLIDNLIYLFNELTKYVEISKEIVDHNDKFFRFEMISEMGELKPQIFRLSSKKESEAKTLEKKIREILSGDSNLDVYTLLNILKNKLNDE